MISFNRGVINLIYSAHWPLKQFFLKTFAMERRTFRGFLISYIVPTMVG